MGRGSRASHERGADHDTGRSGAVGTGISVLTHADTRQHAEWAAGSLRRHAAFEGGDIGVEGPFENSDRLRAVTGQCDYFRVVYRGPIRHAEVGCGCEPLDLAAEDFTDRRTADRACAAARRDIPEWDISEVHVESLGDRGPWRLVWLHASVRLRGQPQPREPTRPGS